MNSLQGQQRQGKTTILKFHSPCSLHYRAHHKLLVEEWFLLFGITLNLSFLFFLHGSVDFMFFMGYSWKHSPFLVSKGKVIFRKTYSFCNNLPFSFYFNGRNIWWWWHLKSPYLEKWSSWFIWWGFFNYAWGYIP